MTSTQSPSSRRVALVIGSGSVKCAAAIGLYNVLQREAIGVDLVVGCSAGAIYAAMIGLGWDPSVMRDKVTRLWTRDITQKRNNRAVLEALLPNLFNFNAKFGVTDDTLALQRLREGFDNCTFADTRIPLYIATTDFHTGDQVVLHEGSLVDAIRASIAIPFVFRPWQVGEHLLMDGFMSDPMPVDVAIREGARVIVAMGFESPLQHKLDSPVRFAFQISSIMTNNLLKANFAFHNLAHHTEIIPIIPEFEQRIKLFDTDKIPYIIEAGERAAQDQVPYLRSLLAAQS